MPARRRETKKGAPAPAELKDADFDEIAAHVARERALIERKPPRARAVAAPADKVKAPPAEAKDDDPEAPADEAKAVEPPADSRHYYAEISIKFPDKNVKIRVRVYPIRAWADLTPEQVAEYSVLIGEPQDALRSSGPASSASSRRWRTL